VGLRRDGMVVSGAFCAKETTLLYNGEKESGVKGLKRKEKEARRKRVVESTTTRVSLWYHKNGGSITKRLTNF